MEDKEKQIEEMIGILEASNNPFVDVPIEILHNVAEVLYNAGYCKIPENEVVFTKEEYKKIEREKKQLVKEFAEKVKKKYGKSCSEYYPMLIEMTSDDLDKLLKE